MCWSNSQAGDSLQIAGTLGLTYIAAAAQQSAEANINGTDPFSNVALLNWQAPELWLGGACNAPLTADLIYQQLASGEDVDRFFSWYDATNGKPAGGSHVVAITGMGTGMQGIWSCWECSKRSRRDWATRRRADTPAAVVSGQHRGHFLVCLDPSPELSGLKSHQRIGSDRFRRRLLSPRV